MRALKFALILLFIISLQSCKQALNWNASNISGVMPNLDFVLTGPDAGPVKTVSLHGRPLFGLTGPEADLDRLRETYGVYASMESSESKGSYKSKDSYNVMHSPVVFAFDSNGRAGLLISDLDASEAIVSDLRQLIDL